MESVKKVGICLFVMMLAAGSTVASASVYDDAIGYWQFEGTDPQLVVDSTSNGNDLYFGNSTEEDGEDGSRTLDGISGSGMYCPFAAGMASSVTDMDALDFQPDDSFSISVWVKNEKRTKNSYIVSKMESSSPYYRGYGLMWGSDDQLDFILRSDNSTQKYLWVESKINVGDVTEADDWVHLAITYDGSMDKSGVMFYVNGNLLDTTKYADHISTSSLIATDDTTNSKAFDLGGRNTSSIFGGYMDEAAVWGRVLSGQEVQELAAVPEPATIALLALGSFGILRKKR